MIRKQPGHAEGERARKRKIKFTPRDAAQVRDKFLLQTLQRKCSNKIKSRALLSY